MAVAVTPRPSEHRGGTLRVRGGIGLTVSLDPGDCCAGAAPEILAPLYDGLTGLDRFSSSAPGLVADLAVALPAPIAGGKVYTFTLRPGLRYSTGAPVRASDFRRAIERVVRARNEGARAFEHLDGVSRRCPPRRPCDLRDSVVADDVAGTVSFHLDQPDPDFLYKLAGHVAAPVPPGAPARTGTAALRAPAPTACVASRRRGRSCSSATRSSASGHPRRSRPGVRTGSCSRSAELTTTRRRPCCAARPM